jgi:hypothetical protein
MPSLPNRFPLNGSAPVPKRKPTLAERDQKANQILSTRYDALNQLFTEVERHLKSLKPLHPVWVAFDLNQCDGQPDRWELLGLTKHGDKWRLCHAYDHDQNVYGPLHEQPIVECPVEVRVRAAKVVRQLHEKIVKSKEEYIPLVDEAIKELTDLFNGM